LSVFNWKDSQATKLGLFMSTENVQVNSMKRFVEVELCGMDTISVRVIEDDFMRSDSSSQWNGIYRKLASSQPAAASVRPVKGISGRYRSSSGAEFFFNPPRFEWKEGDRAEQGVYSQYGLGEATVLVLKSMKSSGVITGTRTFKVEREDKKDSDGLYERLTLSPARTTVSGLELLEQDPIVLRSASK